MLINGKELLVENLFLGKSLVSWTSKKQDAISLSTTKFEYIVAASNYTQVIWMKQMMKDIRVVYNEPTVIYCDNYSAINISKNPMFHSKTKHILINFHCLREKVSGKEIRQEYVSTKEQISYIFTKPLLAETFVYLRNKLGVIAMNQMHCVASIQWTSLFYFAISTDEWVLLLWGSSQCMVLLFILVS